MEEKDSNGGFFKVPNLSFDEYRNQEVIETNDGAFFDGLDEMFDIESRTDSLKEAEEK